MARCSYCKVECEYIDKVGSDYVLLAEVRAFLEKSRRQHNHCEADGYNDELDKILRKISEHFR